MTIKKIYELPKKKNNATDMMGSFPENIYVRRWSFPALFSITERHFQVPVTQK